MTPPTEEVPPITVVAENVAALIAAGAHMVPSATGISMRKGRAMPVVVADQWELSNVEM